MCFHQIACSLFAQAMILLSKLAPMARILCYLAVRRLDQGAIFGGISFRLRKNALSRQRKNGALANSILCPVTRKISYLCQHDVQKLLEYTICPFNLILACCCYTDNRCPNNIG